MGGSRFLIVRIEGTDDVSDYSSSYSAFLQSIGGVWHSSLWMLGREPFPRTRRSRSHVPANASTLTSFWNKRPSQQSCTTASRSI